MMQQHTLILGQSGSGKSFFLTRLVEELILRTSARVLVLDPNGDYQNLDRVNSRAFFEHKEVLTAVANDCSTRQIPILDDCDSFQTEWGQRNFRILSFQRENDGLPQSTGTITRAHIWLSWSEIRESHDFLLDFANPGQPISSRIRNALTACYLLARQGTDGREPLERFGLDALADAANQFREGKVRFDLFPDVRLLKQEEWPDVVALIERIKQNFSCWYDHSPGLSPEIRRHLEVPFKDTAEDPWNAIVLALNRARTPLDSLLVAETALRSIWDFSKENWEISLVDPTRPPIMPTFVVVDEAHNFAPKDITNDLQARVRDRLVQIAAEGRKYGIYLILGTQRPRKLHDALTLECENFALMRVQSQEELRFAEENFGLKGVSVVQDVPQFSVGSALISGRWVRDVEVVRVAPARSAVSGGNVSDAWMSRPLVARLESDILGKVDEVVKVLQQNGGKVSQGGPLGQLSVAGKSFRDLAEPEQVRLLELIAVESQDLVFARYSRAKGKHAWQLVHVPTFEKHVGTQVKRSTGDNKTWAVDLIRGLVKSNGPVLLSVIGEVLIRQSTKQVPAINVADWFGEGTLTNFLTNNLPELAIGYSQNNAAMLYNPHNDSLKDAPTAESPRMDKESQKLKDLIQRAEANGVAMPRFRTGEQAQCISLIARFAPQYADANSGEVDLPAIRSAVRLAMEQESGGVSSRDLWKLTVGLMKCGHHVVPTFHAGTALADYREFQVQRLEEARVLLPGDREIMLDWIGQTDVAEKPASALSI